MTSSERLSNRQIRVLKQLAVCCSGGSPAGLTRPQREAILPLWRRGLIELWFRYLPDEGQAGVPFFRPSEPGHIVISGDDAEPIALPPVATAPAILAGTPATWAINSVVGSGCTTLITPGSSSNTVAYVTTAGTR